MHNSERSSAVKWASYCIVFISICLLLYFAGHIVLPFIFALFISILLLPIVRFLERIYFPGWLAALVAMLMVTSFVGGVGYFLYLELDVMVRELPEITKNNNYLVHTDKFISNIEIRSKLEEWSVDIVQNSATYLQRLLTYISSTIFMLFLIPVYIFFMLVNRDRVDSFIRERYKHQLNEGTSIVKQVRNSVFRYTAGLFLVITIVGILISIGLYIIGIPYWLLLGVLCALLGLLPYIGVVIGAILPITIAFLTKDSIWYPIVVLLMFIVVQFLEGNLITPKIVGNTVNVNPVALTLGLLIMGFLTGLLGLILTIPLLAVIRILLESSDELRPIARLIAHRDIQ